MIRAGEGIVINYDGGGAEIATSTAQWFVAEITGTVAATTPVNHKWKKKVPKKDGKSFEDANPPVIGDGVANPAYLPALTTGTTSTATATGLVFMRLRSTNDDGQCVYEIVSGGGGGGGSGSATITVVTGVGCSVEDGLEVTYATFSGADYDNAITRQFLSLQDVTPISFAGNQGRVVKVNDAATALEFGVLASGSPTYTTFIALSDTPATFAGSKGDAGKTLMVGFDGVSIDFVQANISGNYSITGGGNPNNVFTFAPLRLVNDTASPGNNKYYGTTSTGVRGWQSIQSLLDAIADLTARVTALEAP